MTLPSHSQARLVPPASLIICSRNRASLLHETVASVLAGDVVPAELVLVDQSDIRDSVLADLTTKRPCEIRYIWTHERGVSRARNLGMEAAAHALLAFTDDDVLVTPGWFAELIGALADAGPDAVITGRVLATGEGRAGGFAPATMVYTSPATYQGRINRDVLQAGNMALARSAVERIGGFDERLGPGTRYPAGEDNDYGLRLLAAGYRILYRPEALLYHRAWREQREFLPLRWKYGIGQGAYYAKHLGGRDLYMLKRLARLSGRHLLRAVRRAPREPRAALGHLAYLGGVGAGLVRWKLGR